MRDINTSVLFFPGGRYGWYFAFGGERIPLHIKVEDAENLPAKVKVLANAAPAGDYPFTVEVKGGDVYDEVVFTRIQAEGLLRNSNSNIGGCDWDEE